MTAKKIDDSTEATKNGTGRSIYELWGTDKKAEEEGIVLNYGDAGWLKCGRAGGANKRYQRRIEQFGRKYRRQLELDTMPEDRATEELIKIYADTIVFDGELRNREGDMVPLRGNREAVIKFFTELPDLFADVREATGKPNLFKEALKTEEAKN